MIQERNYSQENYQKLHPIERRIFDMMAPQNGVVMLQGKPGIGKTAIVRSIARKLKFQFFEFALTHIDAADLGGLPVIKHVKCEMDGVMVDVPQMGYAVNDWAVQANSAPSILFFDEANRPTDEVINALLKLFEGHIGLNFKFNKNVYMISAGNLGMEEDGTTVTALDSAMNNRIIHIPFKMTIKDWVTNFAREHVHPLVISFIESHKDHFHNMVPEQDIYASPRSWTMFSDYLVYHGIHDLEEVQSTVFSLCNRYIGDHSTSAFKMYLDSLLSARIPSMKEIVSRGKKLKSELEALNFPQLTYIVNSFEIEDIKNCGEKELLTFMNTLTDDQIATMYSRIITSTIKNSKTENDPGYVPMNILIKPFKPALRVKEKIAQSLLDA